MDRMLLGRIVHAAAALVLFAGVARAQDYPARPILILCGQPAGSGPDTMIRLYADAIGKNVGQRLVVDNRAGAGGIVAANALTQAQPDGYTLLVALGGMHTIVPALQHLPFDPINDFEFITLLYASSGLLLVPAASPAKSFGEFIAYVKAKPGGASYGTPGLGSPAHLMSAMLADRLGVPMTHIPYKGGGQIIVDLIAGRMDFAFISSVQAKPHVREGTVRALAVGGPRRMDWCGPRRCRHSILVRRRGAKSNAGSGDGAYPRRIHQGIGRSTDRQTGRARQCHDHDRLQAGDIAASRI
jgi:tripartite-type tricarboxylate transporter receptor subunit TctC